jgi:hypothetical protein
VLADLPPGKRQPNLLFGVLRWHGVPVEDPLAALAWLHEHSATALADMRARRTQTNEVARCAVLLPALAAISPTPLALIEVGASAGLCLMFDAWRYHYVGADLDHYVGSSSTDLVLTCTVEGQIPLPGHVPEIAWRTGIDLNPLDPGQPDVQRWLECLVWPEHHQRADNLRAALSVAQDSDVRVEVGDLITDLPELLRRVPHGLTPVVLHSATLAYLGEFERSAADVRHRRATTGRYRDKGAFRRHRRRSTTGTRRRPRQPAHVAVAACWTPTRTCGPNPTTGPEKPSTRS